MTLKLASMPVAREEDTVTARRLATRVAKMVGLSPQDTVRLTTALSEVVRNALIYGGGGQLECDLLQEDPVQFVQFVVRDQGPGIRNVDRVLNGYYRSDTGLGKGLRGAKELMDRFQVDSIAEEGTTVTLAKQIPTERAPVTADRARTWFEELASETRKSTIEQIHRQNLEMIEMLGALRDKEKLLEERLAESQRLNRELTLAKKRLSELATFDALTGLLNRRTVLEMLDRELARSGRSGKPFGVLMGDLDHFKQLNDTYGHLAGDEVLREVARRLEGVTRVYDSIGRYGGEEFLMVFPGCGRHTMKTLGERIRRAIGDEPIVLEQGPVAVTISLGAMTISGQSDTDEIIEQVDAIMYQAKANGRNRLEVAIGDIQD